MVTMGLYTMMERLSESGRSYCRNRHVTNSYLCYQCYWLSIPISPCSDLLLFRSFFLPYRVAFVLFQIRKPDDILYRIMGYVRRINYTTLESSRDVWLIFLPGFLFTDIFVHGDECSSIKVAKSDFEEITKSLVTEKMSFIIETIFYHLTIILNKHEITIDVKIFTISTWRLH